MSYVGSSQSRVTEDTICFPVSVVKERLTEAKQGREAKKLISVMKEEIAATDIKIAKLESLVKEVESRSDSEKEKVRLLNENIADMKSQRVYLESRIGVLEKALRRERNKTKVIGLLGFIGMLVVGFK
jgi:peptidoglycan hydrolase CwlO-like protein